MPNLTDHIEEYLKKLLALSCKSYIEIRRSELASKFSCVPSQINYVLERRFAPERGYLVESRRGGGGYIRIYRVDCEEDRNWAELLSSMEESKFEPDSIRHLVKRMYEEKVLSRREARLLETLVRDTVYDSCAMSKMQARRIQKRLLSEILTEFLKTDY